MKGFARFAIGIGLVVMFTAASPAVAVAPPNNDGSDGSGNTAGGTNALGVLSTGFSNTAFGSQALAANTTASDNAAFGTSALTSATTGGFNTAVGASALFGNTTGTGNTAAGSFALEANVSGQSNTAVGESALRDNTGHLNTAVGSEALTNNTTGGTNAALGWAALMSNTTGANNAASGAAALAANTSGQGNTADGHNALASNDSGDFNAAVGDGALASNVAGKSNVAVGAGALASATGEGNVALGRNAGKRLVTGSNDVYVANPGASSESGVIRIGKKGVHTSAFLAGVSGVPVAGVPVVVTASGRLGVQASSERFKRDVETMGDRSRALLDLRPVTFRYDGDRKGTRQYGLVAEEVARVYPELAVRADDGSIVSVRYDEMIAMLVNELQREHREVAALESELARRTAREADVTDRLERLERAVAAQSTGLKPTFPQRASNM